MTATFKIPDVRQLAEGELPQALFPVSRGEDFRVYFRKEVHEQIARHAGEDLSVEIGGVLAGQWNCDEEGPFVAVREAIGCAKAVSRSGEVTFTHDAWAQIHHEMDNRYPQLSIVGWYHSHPNFGIFLSERDRFIHEHFFSNPGQIAYVVDPVRNDEGVFAWREGETRLCPHYWIGDRIFAGSERAVPKSPAVSHGAAGSLSPPSRSGRWIWDAASYLAVFLIGLLVASLPGGWERNRLVEGTVAHYGIWRGLRPGLENDLATAGSRLARIARSLDVLQAKSIKTGDKTAADSAAWKQVREEIRQAVGVLRHAEELYCLTSEEKAAVAEEVVRKVAQLRHPALAAEAAAEAGSGGSTEPPKKGVSNFQENSAPSPRDPHKAAPSSESLSKELENRGDAKEPAGALPKPSGGAEKTKDH